jgi:hypothetical protein
MEEISVKSQEKLTSFKKQYERLIEDLDRHVELLEERNRIIIKSIIKLEAIRMDEFISLLSVGEMTDLKRLVEIWDYEYNRALIAVNGEIENVIVTVNHQESEPGLKKVFNKLLEHLDVLGLKLEFILVYRLLKFAIEK